MVFAMKLAAFCLGALLRPGEAMTLRGAGSNATGTADELQRLLLTGEADAADADQLQRLLLVAEAGTPSMKGFTGQLERLVAKLTAQVLASHKVDDATVKSKLIEPFDLCRGHKAGSNAGVTSKRVRVMETKHSKKVKKHKKCLAEHASKVGELKTCRMVQASYLSAKKDSCRDFDDKKDSSVSVCNILDTQKTRLDWLAYMQRHLKSEDKRLKKMERQCKSSKRKLKLQKGECKRAAKRAKSVKKRCEKKDQKLQLAACDLKSARSSMCKNYESCRKNAVSSYYAFTNSTAERVTTRKLQWRMLKRLDCLVKAYDAKTGVDKEKLKACAAAGKYGTDHLNIVYPEVPAKAPCDGGAGMKCIVDDWQTKLKKRVKKAIKKAKGKKKTLVAKVNSALQSLR